MKKKLYVINFFLVGYILIAILILLAYDTWRVFNDNQNYITPIITKVTPLPTMTPAKEKKLKVHVTIPYWEQQRAYQVLQTNSQHIDYLSLFWYTLNENGSIVQYKDAVVDDSIISYAKQNNIKVMALIANLPDFEDSEWDSARVRGIISSQEKRKNHIDAITKLLDVKGFDGVNIDYEELDDDLRTEFSLFMQELSTALHKRNKLVSVAIHPKSTEYLPAEDNGSRAQDWQELAKHVDHMYFMTYGEHWNTSVAGPIASIPWDTKILAYAKSLNIPMQKVYLGTPLYAVRWQEGTRRGEGLDFDDVKSIEQQFNVKSIWNEQWKSPSLTYVDNGRNYVVHFENAQSVKEKLKLAEDYKVGGITLWHIGGEDPQVWERVSKLQ